MPEERPRGRAAIALVLGVLLLAGLTLTACGGGGDSSSGTTTGSSGSTTGAENEGGETSGGSSLDAELEKELAAWEEIPTSIAQTEPLKKGPPTGATIAYLDCEAQPCAETNEGLEAAAKAMGVKYKSISAGASPESFQAAAAQAVREKPDVLLMSSLDGSLISKQLTQLKNEGVKTINWAVSNSKPGEFSLLYIGNEVDEAIGEAVAQYTVLHHGEEANLLYVNQSIYGSIVVFGEGIENGLKKACPKCTFSEIDTLPEEIGSEVPTKVVSFLQKEPSTEYAIVPAYGALSLGLPQALKAAALTSPIVGGQNGSSNTWEDIKNGVQEMSMEIDLRLLSFYAMDAAARLINGEEPLADEQIPWYQLVTKEDITFDPSTEGWHPLPNFEEEFATLWSGK